LRRLATFRIHPASWRPFRSPLAVPPADIERNIHTRRPQMVGENAIVQGSGYNHAPDRQGRYALRQRAASGRSRRRFPVRLRSRTLTIALNTVSKARRAVSSLRHVGRQRDQGAGVLNIFNVLP